MEVPDRGHSLHLRWPCFQEPRSVLAGSPVPLRSRIGPSLHLPRSVDSDHRENNKCRPCMTSRREHPRSGRAAHRAREPRLARPQARGSASQRQQGGWDTEERPGVPSGPPGEGRQGAAGSSAPYPSSGALPPPTPEVPAHLGQDRQRHLQQLRLVHAVQRRRPGQCTGDAQRGKRWVRPPAPPPWPLPRPSGATCAPPPPAAARRWGPGPPPPARPPPPPSRPGAAAAEPQPPCPRGAVLPGRLPPSHRGCFPPDRECRGAGKVAPGRLKTHVMTESRVWSGRQAISPSLILHQGANTALSQLRSRRRVGNEACSLRALGQPGGPGPASPRTLHYGAAVPPRALGYGAAVPPRSDRLRCSRTAPGCSVTVQPCHPGAIGYGAAVPPRTLGYGAAVPPRALGYGAAVPLRGAPLRRRRAAPSAPAAAGAPSAGPGAQGSSAPPERRGLMPGREERGAWAKDGVKAPLGIQHVEHCSSKIRPFLPSRFLAQCQRCANALSFCIAALAWRMFFILSFPVWGFCFAHSPTYEANLKVVSLQKAQLTLCEGWKITSGRK